MTAKPSFRVVLSMLSMLVITATVPKAFCAEEQTLSGLMPDYVVSWRIEAHPSETPLLISDDYFGEMSATAGKRIYRHYDTEGKLLWSTQNFDYSPAGVSLSRTGNRIILGRLLDTTSPGSAFSVEIYDEQGTNLLTLTGMRTWVNSSPSGRFYYSLPDRDGYKPLTVFDTNGQILFTREPSSAAFWSAEALTDSLLAFLDNEKLDIISVPGNQIIKSISKEQITGGKSGSLEMRSAENGKKLLLWSKHDIYTVAPASNRITRTRINGRLRDAAFGENSDRLIYIYFDKSDPGIGLVDSLGNILWQQKIPFAAGEKWSREGSLWLGSDLFIVNYLGRVTSQGSMLRQRRSFLGHLDSVSGNLEKSATLDGAFYPVSSQGVLLEKSDLLIQGWAK
jgi:hypothetical protein